MVVGTDGKNINVENGMEVSEPVITLGEEAVLEEVVVVWVWAWVWAVEVVVVRLVWVVGDIEIRMRTKNGFDDIPFQLLVVAPVARWVSDYSI